MSDIAANPGAPGDPPGPEDEDDTPPTTVPSRPPVRLRWWHEALFIAIFYAVYSAVRNQFGSAAVDPGRALDNALDIIELERAMGLFVEERVQAFFLDWTLFIKAWNVFYGTFHFVVTIGALAYLFLRQPHRYPTWRNTLAATTALALIGFSLFPLMPPRLLNDCGVYGGCLTEFTFVDTLVDPGGLWSFDSGAMQEISNQYAAMPSLHFGWSFWCFLVLFPHMRRRWTRVLVALYPWVTLFAIVVTANHYWLDAAGGALVLAVGYLIGSRLARFTARRREARFREDVDRPAPV
ncbi:MAG: phosphatase PAP2 family protein [Acidimicrobiales bacterium]|jgi:hypothetical protein|nr:phosphatase PAP2 family protein [Acidimicrobiales bacterium]